MCVCVCVCVPLCVHVSFPISPGQYEHEVDRSRKPQCRESFGGQRTLIPTIATKCTGGEPDKVYTHIRTYICMYINT